MMESILGLLVVAVIVIFAVFEIFLIMTNRPTISSMIKKAYQNYPPLGMLTALVVGLLLGHFFWF